MANWQKILLHPYGITDTEALVCRQRGNGSVLWDPVGRRENLPLVFNQDSVVYQRECRQTETTAGKNAKRPAGKLAVDLIGHVGKPNAVSALVSQKSRFRWINSICLGV